jgi:hypothetical protein
MNMLSFCIAPLVLSTAALQSTPTRSQSDPSLRALAQLDDTTLCDLRGGAPEMRMALGDDELASLRAADAASTDLADLRGGTLDDHDLTIIAVVALAIIAIAIIL